ncbi:hypothetical protein M9435_000553 [Picochlorum sp. BPE23]|nr:hypothetical protein M9435_000553 [Picochlorum sp. BPE23]
MATECAEFSDTAIIQCFSSHGLSIQDDLNKLKEVLVVLGTAAGFAKVYGDQGDYDRAYRSALETVEQYRELKLVLDALVYLGSKGNAHSYRIGSETTNFESLIEEAVLTLRSEGRAAVSAAEDSLMETFRSAEREVAPQTQNEVIDDEIEIQGGSGNTKNTKCPITMVDIYKLQDPVEDKNGFVYEKNAIMLYIKKAGARRPPVCLRLGRKG